ncbi:uncharacterized protein LOC135833455 isoform X2 [Planococcus citri]|uniref:uncharacterized protein LOC135833455 isoform X2 n=1 Tax=Planococcus citri TaxID=170843 RepID=UPI0031F90A7E
MVKYKLEDDSDEDSGFLEESVNDDETKFETSSGNGESTKENSNKIKLGRGKQSLTFEFEDELGRNFEATIDISDICIKFKGFIGQIIRENSDGKKANADVSSKDSKSFKEKVVPMTSERFPDGLNDLENASKLPITKATDGKSSTEVAQSTSSDCHCQMDFDHIEKLLNECKNDLDDIENLRTEENSPEEVKSANELLTVNLQQISSKKCENEKLTRENYEAEYVNFSSTVNGEVASNKTHEHSNALAVPINEEPATMSEEQLVPNCKGQTQNKGGEQNSEHDDKVVIEEIEITSIVPNETHNHMNIITIPEPINEISAPVAELMQIPSEKCKNNDDITEKSAEENDELEYLNAVRILFGDESSSDSHTSYEDSNSMEKELVTSPTHITDDGQGKDEIEADLAPISQYDGKTPANKISSTTISYETHDNIAISKPSDEILTTRNCENDLDNAKKKKNCQNDFGVNETSSKQNADVQDLNSPTIFNDDLFNSSHEDFNSAENLANEKLVSKHELNPNHEAQSEDSESSISELEDKSLSEKEIPTVSDAQAQKNDCITTENSADGIPAKLTQTASEKFGNNLDVNEKLTMKNSTLDHEDKVNTKCTRSIFNLPQNDTTSKLKKNEAPCQLLHQSDEPSNTPQSQASASNSILNPADDKSQIPEFVKCSSENKDPESNTSIKCTQEKLLTRSYLDHLRQEKQSTSTKISQEQKPISPEINAGQKSASDNASKLDHFNNKFQSSFKVINESEKQEIGKVTPKSIKQKPIALVEGCQRRVAATNERPSESLESRLTTDSNSERTPNVSSTSSASANLEINRPAPRNISSASVNQSLPQSPQSSTVITRSVPTVSDLYRSDYYTPTFTPTYREPTLFSRVSTSYRGSNDLCTSSYYTNSCEYDDPRRTKKFNEFVANPGSKKSITDLPGVGRVGGQRLRDRGFDTPEKVRRQFVKLGGDKKTFQKWMKNTTGLNSRYSSDCFDALDRTY